MNVCSQLSCEHLLICVYSYEKKLIWAPTFMICIGPGCNSGQIHKGGDTQPIRPWASVQFGTNSRGRRRSAHYDMRSMELRTNEGGDTQPIMTCTACTFKMCWTHHLRKPQSMDAIFHRRFNKSDSKKPSVPVKWERFTKADC
jgi:hypothetical protein